jgi:PIN domain nuclease of toxin-antitoxin system
MAPYATRLADILRDQGGVIAPFTPDICLQARLRDWAHRDPYGRLIATTAEVQNLTLIARDAAFARLDTITVRW